MMGGGTVGIVEASNNPRFKAGDAVVGMGGWQRYSVSDGASLRVVDAKTIPIQAYLGPVGMPGVTAWYGLNKIIAPKAERNSAGVGGDRRGRLGGRPARQGRWRANGRDRRGPAEMRLRRQGTRLRRLRRPQVASLRRGFEGRVVRTESTGCSRTSAASRFAWRCGGSTISPGSRSAASSPLMKASRRRRPTCGSSSSSGSRWKASSSRTIWIYGRRRSASSPVWSPPRSSIWRETIRDGLESAPQALVDLLHGQNFGKMLVRVD